MYFEIKFNMCNTNFDSVEDLIAHFGRIMHEEIGLYSVQDLSHSDFKFNITMESKDDYRTLDTLSITISGRVIITPSEEPTFMPRLFCCIDGPHNIALLNQFIVDGKGGVYQCL